MAFFGERIEERDGPEGGKHRFWVSDDGDLYALREMYEMGNGRSVYEVDIRPGMRVLDIGAHKGIFAVWAAKQGAKVTAYEPDPETYKALVANIDLNEVGRRVTACRAGVMGSGGHLLRFYSDPENSIGSTFYRDRIDGQCRAYDVPVVSFDEAMEESDWWDLVKIDAEQAEYGMLLSSWKLDRIGHLSFEWHCPPGQRDCPELHEVVDRLGRYFDVPEINYDWWLMSMKRKSIGGP